MNQLTSHAADHRVAFSCVVDNQPRFHSQGALWATCLLDYQGIPAERIYVHVVEPADQEFANWVRLQGIHLVKIQRFDSRSAHCNKLGQLITEFGKNIDRVVLMDCDTVWLGQLPLPVTQGVAAKIVDKANPAPEILDGIFKAAGVGPPNWTQISVPDPGANSLTDSNNCNGGMYIVASECVRALAVAWPRWAEWCLEQRHLFGRFINFDQVSFALAMREMGLQTDLLGLAWNFPIHYPDWPLPSLDPQIIHYHRRLSPQLEVMPIGLARIDDAIAEFNLKMAGRLKARNAFSEVGPANI